MIRAALSLLLVAALAAADHDAWAQGRPAEALPGLLRAAETADTWQAWTDAGLCAADAGQRGEAVAALWRARRLAPLADAPARALTALGADTPVLWSDRCGPVAWAGGGWWAIPLMAAAGAALGLALVRRDPRLVLAGGGILLVAGPGLVAGWRDRLDPHRIVRQPTALVDATGSPLAGLDAGAVIRIHGDAFAGRWPVILADGRAGFVAADDLR